ncbi:PD-(D/E)XK motif protein [Gordonia sp. NPDC003429]
MTKPAEYDARHTPFGVIETYVSEGLPGVFSVDGVPEGRIELIPCDRTISLLLEATKHVSDPRVNELANIEYFVEDHGGTMFHRLQVTYEDNLAEVYPVLCTIADSVQMRHNTFTDAVRSVLAGLGEILAGRGELSLEKQIGLYGEIMVLIALATWLSPTEALEAWRGADREEHDFGLKDLDLEVKTTTTEKRSHWISGIGQLFPTNDRPLYLLSIQITPAGAGPGISLAGLVDVARALPGIPVSHLDMLLGVTGYRFRHADLYQSRWSLRSNPMFLRVDDRFPAIVRERLDAIVPQAERIEDVRYRIGLDGLEGQDPLFDIELPKGL